MDKIIECRKLRLYPAVLPNNFHDAVKMLNRPYEVISKKVYEYLLRKLKKTGYDCFMYKGQIVTIGNADGGYAIMPLNKKYQQSNKICKGIRILTP